MKINKSILYTFSTLLLLNTIAFSQYLNTNWALGIGNGNGIHAEGKSVSTDLNGNRFTLGEYEGLLNFDTLVSGKQLSSTGGKDLVIIKHDSVGNLLWIKNIGGKSNDIGYSIITDAPGNFFIVGSFIDSLDFDPGIGKAVKISAGATDIFIAKYDNNGNYIWANSIGGKKNDVAKKIIIDPIGDIYVTGTFQDTVDFNPGLQINNLMVRPNYSGMFFAKYDFSGNYIWAKSIRGGKIGTFVVDRKGEMYVSGSFRDTVDFDPGSGVANLIGRTVDYAIFFAKYDADGNYLWAKKIESMWDEQCMSLIVDTLGHIYLTGVFSNTLDFDPGSNTANLTTSGSTDIFIAKYDTSGNYIWVKNMGGAALASVGFIGLDNLSRILVTGNFTGTADFDPGIGTANIISNSGSSDIFIAYYDTSGNYILANGIGNELPELINSTFIDYKGKILITGYFSRIVDFDPGSGIKNLSSYKTNFNLFTAAYRLNNSLIWAYAPVEEDGGDDQGQCITTDKFGNIYIAGAITGTVDFDPSTGFVKLGNTLGSSMFVAKYNSTGNYIWATHLNNASAGAIAVDSLGNTYVGGSLNNYDMFIAKYNINGKSIWLKTLKGSSDSYFNALKLDNKGHLYIAGSFENTTDFDPGSGTANRTSASSSISDIFLAKYDTSGNFIWVNAFGSTGEDAGNALDVRKGEIYVAGYFVGTVDFDPSSSMYNIVSNTTSYSDLFFAKYDTLGKFIWAKGIGGSSEDKAHSITVDVWGNTYIFGENTLTVDFDPGLGTANLSGSNFIAKYDSNGNYLWANRINNVTPGIRGTYLALCKSGGIYLTGLFPYTSTFYNKANNVSLTSKGGTDIFISKYDASGNFLWAESIGGSGDDYVRSIAMNGSDTIYLTGNFTGNSDFDPEGGILNLTSNTGVSNLSADIFIAKYTSGICASLSVKVDSLSSFSCTKSTAYTKVFAYGGSLPYNYKWSTIPITNDSVVNFNSSGNYVLTVSDANNCVLKLGYIMNAPNSSVFDLDVNLLANNFLKGRPSSIWLNGYNGGCVPTTGSLMIVLDNLLNYTGATPTPSAIVGDTLKWNFFGLTYDSLHILPHIFVTTSLSANLGDSICLEVLITPLTGDINKSNNKKKYCFLVYNAYDPNDKKVYPLGIGANGNISNNQSMTYTIRFQNTGNTTATNVYILDTLNPKLDINTLKILGTSHSMTTEIHLGNVLKFKFDNINLPDSTSNKQLSQGYVIFIVDQYPNLSVGTQITNTADIYFDFNSAIVTNTTLNTIFSSTTGIDEKYKEDMFSVYPNPSNGHVVIQLVEQMKISIYNSLGEEILNRQLMPGKHDIFLPSSSMGLYLVKANGKETMNTIIVAVQ